MNFKTVKINRIIIHKIIGKKTNGDAYLIPSDDLHKLDEETETTLKSRITHAVSKSKRFFETKIERTDKESFWAIAKQLGKANKKEFIKFSTEIAKIAVDAHQNASIPGGLLIIIDGTIDKFESVIIIKAELVEALTLKGNSVELMKELFLSPAKEFYKVGFLIHKNVKNQRPTNYASYVYDDTFNPKRNDIAEYFYKSLLGFSTSENDKLKTNNFLKTFIEFVDENIDEPESRKNIKIRIKADYRESSNMIIDPSTYSDFFDGDSTLLKKFQDQVLFNYPQSFTKDLELVESSLHKGTLQIDPDLKLVGPTEVLDNAEVIDSKERGFVKKLTTEIQSGKISKVIVINHLINSEESKDV